MNKITKTCRGCRDFKGMGIKKKCINPGPCPRRMLPARGKMYVKSTVYIEKGVYDALQELYVSYGDKKKIINEAIEDLIKKKAGEGENHDNNA